MQLWLFWHCQVRVNVILELTHQQRTTGNREEQRERLSWHYAITLTQEMVHSQGISPSNLFIHFLQRGNLMHDLIHLCDVAEMPAALRDTSSIFGPQINTQSKKYWMAAKETRGAGGWRGGVADAKTGNLSFNLRPYIGHFKERHILFAHDPRVSENRSGGFERWRRRGERFSRGCSSCTDPLKGSEKARQDQVACQNQRNVGSLSGSFRCRTQWHDLRWADWNGQLQDNLAACVCVGGSDRL